MNCSYARANFLTITYKIYIIIQNDEKDRRSTLRFLEKKLIG